MFLPVFVCLSVYLSSKITPFIRVKCVHGFGWNVACRQMSGHGRTVLLSPIRIIVRMPEPDCFLGYRISAATCGILRRDNPIGGAPPQRAVVLTWFYSLSRRKTFVGGKWALPYNFVFYCAAGRHVTLFLCGLLNHWTRRALGIECVRYRVVKKLWQKLLNRFHGIPPEGNGQTNRQTDGQTRLKIICRFLS